MNGFTDIRLADAVPAQLEAHRLHLARRARLGRAPVAICPPSPQVEQHVASTRELEMSEIKSSVMSVYDITEIELREISSKASAARQAIVAATIHRLQLSDRDVADALGIATGGARQARQFFEAWITELCVPRDAPLHATIVGMFEYQASKTDELQPKVEACLRLAADFFLVSPLDIKSARRKADIVRPRQIAMWLAKRCTYRSLPEIGRRFGGRDHTTVLHACRKVDDALARAGRVIPDGARPKQLLETASEAMREVHGHV